GRVHHHDPEQRGCRRFAAVPVRPGPGITPRGTAHVQHLPRAQRRCGPQDPDAGLLPPCDRRIAIYHAKGGAGAVGRSTIYDLRFTIYDLRSTIYDLRSTIYDLRFTIS